MNKSSSSNFFLKSNARTYLQDEASRSQGKNNSGHSFIKKKSSDSRIKVIQIISQKNDNQSNDNSNNKIRCNYTFIKQKNLMFECI